MSGALLISVRLHDGRYHGAGDWPPTPARLFQALVAGAGLGGSLGKGVSEALGWFERQEPPLIGAPISRAGQRVMFYMPNNDLDSVGGDPRRVAEIRTAAKFSRPVLFDATIPLLYAWPLDSAGEQESLAQDVCTLSEHLYQLGRGVDMAWAWGEILDEAELEERLTTYPGRIFRPSRGGEPTLACPQPGSLRSLMDRYAASSHRFTPVGDRQLFSQPPKPRFKQVAYESPSSKHLYDLRDGSRGSAFGVWPLARASKLVEWVRDGAVHRLRQALPERVADIERAIVGRKANGADEGPTSSRIRIIPLPSIGHPQVSHGIRRVLVDVPSDCPLTAGDVHWAFSGLPISDPKTGELSDLVLTAAGDTSMLAHYGLSDRFRVWRSLTPVALPESARRRRIEPTRMLEEAKGGSERAAEHARAQRAVAQALRHADVRAHAAAITVQREPFEAKGERVESFASGTRFAKERLWHVEIAFDASIGGPLAIGDGRFLGLGVMAPVEQHEGVHAFVVERGLEISARPIDVTRALRRAVMARVHDVLGKRTKLPAFVSGHEDDRSPARIERSSHLTFAFDPARSRVLIIAPHVVERRGATHEERDGLRSLDAALRGFRELRAGAAGRLTLRASAIDRDLDPIFAPSRTWDTLTAYEVTRHVKRVGAAEALSADIRAECRRHKLPVPHVTTRDLRGVPGVGLLGGARLTFQVAVYGPIVLGRTRYFGGGLFAGTRHPDEG